MLLCAHHASTCVVAEAGGALSGWTSAYRLPQQPDTVFVWQLAVAPSARGHGLALRMLEHLLARPALEGCRMLETTVSPSNRASRRVFDLLAQRLDAATAESSFFTQDCFDDQHHEPEMLIRVGPWSSGPA